MFWEVWEYPDFIFGKQRFVIVSNNEIICEI